MHLGSESQHLLQAGTPLPSGHSWRPIWFAACALAATGALAFCLVVVSLHGAPSAPRQLQLAGVGTAANDTCLVTGGVGEKYARFAKLLGKTKAAYAKKWGYRSYVYTAPDYEDSFIAWCQATEFGKHMQHIVGSNWSGFYFHPVIKFCAIAHAMNARNCTNVLWTDGDGAIVNWNASLSFDWPGSVKTSSKLWLLVPLAGSPQGHSPGGAYEWGADLPVEQAIDFCQTADACSNFSKFFSCLNSGVFLMQRSKEAFDMMEDAIRRSGLTYDGRIAECSTAGMNPWGFEQCEFGGDQCGIGCSLKRMQPNGSDPHSMPDGISCVSLVVDQRLQDTMNPKWFDENLEVEQGRKPSDTSFFLNPMGSSNPKNPMNKGKVYDWLLNHYPTMKEFSDGLDEATRRWLTCGGNPSCDWS